jgi:sugar phosphate isomerase/epimerase
MNIKLACADFAFPLLSHEQSLRLIAMLGFEGVDIGLFEGRSHLWPSREFEDVTRSSAALKRQTDALGLRVADVFLQTAPDFRPYAINQPDASKRQVARDWFSRTLEYAAGCGCGHVTILPGVHFEEESRDQSFARAVEELSWRRRSRSCRTSGRSAPARMTPRVSSSTSFV